MTASELIPASQTAPSLTNNAKRFYGGLFGVSAESQALDMILARRLLTSIKERVIDNADDHTRPGLLQKFALAAVHLEVDTPHQTALLLQEDGIATNKAVVAGEIRVLTRIIHQQFSSAEIDGLLAETCVPPDLDGIVSE